MGPGGAVDLRVVRMSGWRSLSSWPWTGSDRDRPNKRKAVSVTASDHSADSGLAAALLEVLQTYQKGGPHQPHDGPPPSKKGKGGPKPKTSQTSGSPLARILIQTIQAALKQGVSDEVVASRVINKISRHGPDDTAEPRAAESNGPRKGWSNLSRRLTNALLQTLCLKLKWMKP